MLSPRSEQISQRRGGFGQVGALHRADEGLGRRLTPALQHLRYPGTHEGRVQARRVVQEQVEVLHHDVEASLRGGREVGVVEGDDHFGHGPGSGDEHMAVVGVGHKAQGGAKWRRR